MENKGDMVRALWLRKLYLDDAREVGRRAGEQGGEFSAREWANGQANDYYPKAEDNPLPVDEWRQKWTAYRDEQLALLQRGIALYEDGYRLKLTPRRIKGLSWEVPQEALDWALWPAGHIATAEAERLLYVVQARETQGQSQSTAR